jgi:hypothetical protein
VASQVTRTRSVRRFETAEHSSFLAAPVAVSAELPVGKPMLESIQGIHAVYQPWLRR